MTLKRVRNAQSLPSTTAIIIEGPSSNTGFVLLTYVIKTTPIAMTEIATFESAISNFVIVFSLSNI